MKVIRLLSILALGVVLQSCVAVWGKGYQVIHANSEGMLIQYDPVISSPKSIAKIAQAEADKYGRVIVPGQHEKAHYSGIDQRYFKFVKPSTQGRSIY